MGWGQPWVKGPVKDLKPAEAGNGAAVVLECVWFWEDDFVLLPDLVLSHLEPDTLHICKSVKKPRPSSAPVLALALVPVWKMGAVSFARSIAYVPETCCGDRRVEQLRFCQYPTGLTPPLLGVAHPPSSLVSSSTK